MANKLDVVPLTRNNPNLNTVPTPTTGRPAWPNKTDAMARAGHGRAAARNVQETARSNFMTQFVSHVAPPSFENACCQRALAAVMSVQRKRTRIG